MMAMADAEVAQWLQEGIAAAKGGRAAEARRLLEQVIEADEQNEQGWLWLSGVVSSDEERRICLENVLTLNPQNTIAKRGLERLGATKSDVSGEEIVVRKEYAPISAASAVLYPESQVKEWRYRDPTTVRQAPEVTIASHSSFDDVWSRETAVCAYCAAEIEDETTQCPACRRSLMQKQFRYPKPSTNLHVLWVLLAGLGQLFLIQGIYAMIIERVLFGAILAGLLTLLFLGLAAGVYYRQTWAHLAAIAATALVLLAALVNALLPVDLSALDTQLSGIDPSMADFLGSFARDAGGFIRSLQLGAAGLAFVYAIFVSAPDFDRVKEQLAARLDKGLQYGSDYHAAARKHARAGRMATAVLHWQRAAAKEPHQTLYLRHLGLAYAQLGFFERSLDTLNSALQFSTHSTKQAEIQQLISAVKKRKVDSQTRADYNTAVHERIE